jgi:hypothetical protein
MAFKARSIVAISASAVTTRNAKPRLPTLVACSAKLVRPCITGCAMLGGTRLCRK